MEDSQLPPWNSQGKPAEWEMIKDWYRLEPMFDMERQDWQDKNSGEVVYKDRLMQEAVDKHDAIELVRQEARVALRDAGEEVTAEGILWLEAVKNQNS